MQGPSKIDRASTVIAAVLAAAAIAIFFSGCTSTTDTRQGQSQTIIEHHPLPDGGFVEKRSTYDSSEAVSKTKADIDWGGAVSRGIGAAVTGDWAALGGIAGTIVMAGGAAYLQHRSKQEHKDDAAEGWAKYEAAMKDRPHA